MSESIVRKIQPFTIGTKLSVPAVPKCPDFPESYLPTSQALDNCNKLRHNLNEHVTLFLGRTPAVRPGNVPRLVPQPPAPSPPPSSSTSSSPSPSSSATTTISPETMTTMATSTMMTTQVMQGIRHHQRANMAEEDRLNRNAQISPTSAASRSIRKITISSSTDGHTLPRADPEERLGIPRVRVNHQIENNNNNNNITTTTTTSSSSSSSSSNPQVPRIVGVSCENKPNSHFKVLLRRDSDEDRQSTSVRDMRGKHVQQTPVFKALSPKRDLPKGESPVSESKDAPLLLKSTTILDDHCFTQRNALFNKEISQAEAWIKGKLRDLKDGCNIQRSPLADWEEVSQTLQRDLKDFENTLIQLNQMGEQLMCKTNPTSDLVKKQLSQVRDQWQVLKQTAANQTKALGGAKNLHEFNRKVDRLEAWIKEKEEEQWLANLLGENIDKMQLTRRILDLKQDEQLYRNLHEEINHLALKLEKQGKAEGRNISTRRKHINKMWLKVQSLLKDYHENLQLALEVSSFYQQADNIMCAINNMRRGASGSPSQASGGDGEIRDIASQIMMLDVTVSQLSNLHPSLAARVTHKQAEVKDCWALLQKTVRSEKPSAPLSSHFTREDGDPPTAPREPQCSVGTASAPHRLMGKEVKEERNRLKGCAGGREAVTTRVPPCSPDGGSQSAGATEVIPRPQTDAERERKQRSAATIAAALAAAVSRGDHPPPPQLLPQAQLHPQPQLQSQLQKFTVSADKTLSWLKDNVAMATQICYTVGSSSSFEAAKRCQAALEQDILCNRARIELVKKEGRSLVRAQHPGSARIEEFLGQLEVLWEELKRQHQRNVVVLQASEELNFRAVRVMQALGGLESWLEAVETSIKESPVAGDPESMSLAERESCLLERELSTRGTQLQALRQEVDTLRTQRHLHTELLPARIQEVERKYQSVQSALTQQSSELQDTRMLTEFLERVELEGGRYSSLGEPLHSDIDTEPSLLTMPAGGGGVPLLEPIGNPVEELREAVEMLNDTARERGRSVCQDQAIQELLSRHAAVRVRVEKQTQRALALAQEVTARESEMAVRCEPERSGLEGLEEQRTQLQAEHNELQEEVEAMERLAARLDELCPERLLVLGAEVQATLGAAAELRNHMEGNQRRLRQFGQLRDFFLNYLGMISWTEDTRSYIFSESAKHQAKDNPLPVAEMLDQQIEQKFKEFDELSAAAKKLIDSEHHLTKMIKERMEELRSMLGWILVHWRAQKAQWKRRKRRSETEIDEDAIYTEATVCSSSPQATPGQPDTEGPTPGTSASQDRLRTDSSSAAPPCASQDQTPEAHHVTENNYEVMNSVTHSSGSDVTDGPPSSTSCEKSSPQLLVLKDPGSPSQPGTVNLILSFNNTGDSQLQVQGPDGEQGDRSSEPIHRVSTFLHVKDNTATGPVYESMSLPRLSTRVQASASSSYQSPTLSSTTNSSSSSSSSSSSATSPAVTSASCDNLAPQVSTVSFHTLPWGTGKATTSNTTSHNTAASTSSTTSTTTTPTTSTSSTSIFSSLRRRSKKRKKKDVRRHTIQKIMGVEQQTEAEEQREDMGESTHVVDPPTADREPIIYDTHTWPLKERRKRKNAGKSAAAAANANTSIAENSELTDYVKNPLLSDIDAECSGELLSVRPISQGPALPSKASAPSSGPRVKGHCRFLSLGSVLSFELPKDVGVIPCVPDVITIAPPESRRADPNNKSSPGIGDRDRSMALSTFKLARSPPARKEEETRHSPPPAEAAPPPAHVHRAQDQDQDQTQDRKGEEITIAIGEVTHLSAIHQAHQSQNKEEGCVKAIDDSVKESSVGDEEDCIPPEEDSSQENSFPPPPSPVADLSRAASQSSLVSIQTKRLSRLSGLHEEESTASEGDKMAAKSKRSVSNPHAADDQSVANLKQSGLQRQPSVYEDGTVSVIEVQARVSIATDNTTHACPSVHTLIKDLTEHKFHRPQATNSAAAAALQSGKESPLVAVTQNHTSHMVLSFKTSGSNSNSSGGGNPSREDSVDSGLSSSGSFKLSMEAPGGGGETTDSSPSRRVIGRVRAVESGAEGGGGGKSKASTTTASSPVTTVNVHNSRTTTVHPNHQQFEEEEEELEDIWNQTNGYQRNSICSDIMYQGYKEEQSSTPPRQQRAAPSPNKEQAIIYRKLVTASAPNLLVAEFRLPPSIQSVLGYYAKGQCPPKEGGGGGGRVLAKRDRRSWAAFSHHERTSKQATVAFNIETSSHPVSFPDMEDQRKYVYHYKEEEEEEEEDGREEKKEEEEERRRRKEREQGGGGGGGVEVEVNTAVSQDLLSVHMGLGGPSGQSQHCTEDQGYMTITGGRCNKMNGQKPEFPSMEGTLERKHRLQPGGKKAPCRTWNTYHAILYRQTLSFYIDRKDTLRSSASSLPLNLSGAECVPVPEYAKKPHCFSLRLQDGSEYLLSASSRFMMKKWMLRIHANTGSEDAVPSMPMFSSASLQDDCAMMAHASSTRCHCRGKCHCSGHDDVTSCLQTGTLRPTNATLLHKDISHQLPFWLQGRGEDTSTASPPSQAGHGEDDFDPLRIGPLSIHSQDWQSGGSKRRSHSFTSATYQRIRPVRLPPSGGSQDSASNYSVTLLIGDQPSSVSSSGNTSSTTMPKRPSMFGSSALERPLELPLRNYASLPRPRNKSVFKKFFSKKE
ncbi:nucleoprotein TPR isoform X2 [Engraulis encrasicolus]|uniref:nucleoprotein TPR isoform X2 n=1 Tax=Engraulis encrasicolus TaxID=184585 RepID=UPI002FD65C34